MLRLSIALKTFFRMPMRKKRILISTLAWICIAWFFVRILPFRQLAPHLGGAVKKQAELNTRTSTQSAREMANLLNTLVRYLPWSATCLMQVLAAQFWLKRRGIPATIYFGVNTSERSDAIKAHAWLLCGDEILIGKSESAQFKPIIVFRSYDALRQD
jgi:hypothetical protein